MSFLSRASANLETAASSAVPPRSARRGSGQTRRPSEGPALSARPPRLRAPDSESPPCRQLTRRPRSASRSASARASVRPHAPRRSDSARCAAGRMGRIDCPTGSGTPASSVCAVAGTRTGRRRSAPGKVWRWAAADGRLGQPVLGFAPRTMVRSCGDAWFRQGLAVREREPRCRQASLNRRQNEVPANKQPALALAA